MLLQRHATSDTGRAVHRLAKQELTDRRGKEEKKKRLSVSLNKAMRTHRGAHVRKLAEIAAQGIHPHSRDPVRDMVAVPLEIGRNA